MMCFTLRRRDPMFGVTVESWVLGKRGYIRVVSYGA